MAVRWALVGAFGLVVGVGLGACSAEPTPTPNPVVQPGKPGEPNKTLSAEEAAAGVPVVPPNDADFDYAEMMIMHHQQAVEMTALAATRAVNTSVKGLASRIADTQRPEIDMMNTWLERNGRAKVDPAHAGHHMHMTMPGIATPEQLADLAAATGPAFDALFLQLMIKHHEGAVEMAHVVQKDGSDIKVQEMADHVIAEQTDEIKRMHTMLAA
ncbi:DUF305 domain-containing protein [Actinokineospora sp. NBRC 105648]|uniref:DUF305 domain-containing protein n=1 Tax=Actinokineospora sp. NBRC 105648 TaxID=3032206 RepID=UPI0024A1182A|nr:DUF305 domain-containing protein [Actinokineospora sp. NBRC 105648]GLZ41137.1 lipoprotein [Actinokineospora sp. NBRC 105648]